MKRLKRFALLAGLTVLLCGCAQNRLDQVYPTGLLLEGTSPQMAALTETTEPPTVNVVPTRVTTAPTEEPTTETTVAAEPVKKITVQKSPYSETLEAGGKTSFISYADNADAMSWQFTDTAGNTYTQQQTTAALKGLSISVSGDTVYLENIPLEMDGWKVQAKFSNSDETVLSSPAVLTVTEPLNSYDRVLGYYRTLRSHDFDSKELAAYDGVGIIKNEELRKNLETTKFFYCLVDLDGDEQDELLFTAGTDEETVRKKAYILAVFTMADGRPKQIFSGWSEKLGYLLDDNALLMVRISGENREIQRCYLSGGTLKLKARVTAMADTKGETVYRYYDDGAYASGTKMQEKDYKRYAENLTAAVLPLPKLTEIT